MAELVDKEPVGEEGGEDERADVNPEVYSNFILKTCKSQLRNL